MNIKPLLSLALCLPLCGHVSAQTGDVNKELSELAARLGGLIQENELKKVTVLDFTDLKGTETDLGRYIAEELTINLVMNKREFAVLDRANLKSILAEHKLTATGLVDPENAKKLGMFAGVDALILGNTVPLNQNLQITAKIITTDTAEIIGAARVLLPVDEAAGEEQGQSTPVSINGGFFSLKEDPPQVVKTFGDLHVELQPLRIVNGRDYLLSMVITNKNPSKSIWVAVRCDMGNDVMSAVLDADGYEFQSHWSTITGVSYDAYQHGGFFRPTEIKPNETIHPSLKFQSRESRIASPGLCNLRMELLVGNEWEGNFGRATPHTITTRIEAK